MLFVCFFVGHLTVSIFFHMVLELNGGMYYVNNHHITQTYFDMSHWIKHNVSSSRSSGHSKMKHFDLIISQLILALILQQLPCLWIGLPSVDQNLTPCNIKRQIKDFLWSHFNFPLTLILYAHFTLSVCV